MAWILTLGNNVSLENHIQAPVIFFMQEKTVGSIKFCLSKEQSLKWNLWRWNEEKRRKDFIINGFVMQIKAKKTVTRSFCVQLSFRVLWRDYEIKYRTKSWSHENGLKSQQNRSLYTWYFISSRWFPISKKGKHHFILIIIQFACFFKNENAFSTSPTPTPLPHDTLECGFEFETVHLLFLTTYS